VHDVDWYLDVARGPSSLDESARLWCLWGHLSWTGMPLRSSEEASMPGQIRAFDRLSLILPPKIAEDCWLSGQGNYGRSTPTVAKKVLCAPGASRPLTTHHPSSHPNGSESAYRLLRPCCFRTIRSKRRLEIASAESESTEPQVVRLIM
jgi:hypothetical protein